MGMQYHKLRLIIIKFNFALAKTKFVCTRTQLCAQGALVIGKINPRELLKYRESAVLRSLVLIVFVE